MYSKARTKVMLRLIPLLGFCFFFNIMDKSNVSIAALKMNSAIGLTAAVLLRSTEKDAVPPDTTLPSGSTQRFTAAAGFAAASRAGIASFGFVLARLVSH